MAFVHTTLGFSRLTIILAAVGMVALATVPAHGQVGFDEKASQGGSAGTSTHSLQLPDWAEPTTPSRNESQSRSSLKGTMESRSSLRGTMETKAAPPPPDQEQVPVDGGVALLAAAGAGYAFRKLKQDDEERDESDGDV